MSTSSATMLQMPSTSRGQSSPDVRGRRLFNGVGLSAISRLLGALGPLMTIPVALDQLGPTQFGAWSAALSLTSLIAFADLGLGAGLMTRLAGALTTRDLQRARTLVSSAYMALAALVALLTLLLWGSASWLDYSRVVGGAGDEGVAEVVLVTLSIFVAGIVSNLIVRIQYAAQQVAYSNAWQSGGSLAAVGAAYLAAWSDITGALFVIILAGTPLIFAATNTLHFFTVGRGTAFRPRLSDWGLEALFDLLRLGAGFLAINILMTAALSTDNLIVGHAAGLESVPVYAISARLFGFMALVTYIFAGPLWPMNVEAMAQGDISWVRRTTFRMCLLSGATAIVLALMATLGGPALITAWVDSDLNPSTLLFAGFGTMLAAQAFASPIFMVLNAAEVITPQIIGYGILLSVLPIKWSLAASDRVDLVPWSGAASYIIVLGPCLVIGYRKALRKAPASSNSES